MSDTDTSADPLPSRTAPGRSARGRLLVVTGMSGAGRSTALKALEDMGYEAVDNLPLSLLPNLLSAPAQSPPLALGVDVRTRDFGVGALLATLDQLVAEHHLELNIVFLDCEDDRLIRRYTETRRRHPLAGDRPVSDGIALERQRVLPLRDRADLVIDTTALNPGDLKRLLHGHFALDAAPGIATFVTSFSYRHGLPRDADLVFDVRFLRNPHYVAALRPLTGRDAPVRAFIEADPDFPSFFERLCGWLAPLLPRYEREGKSYLTIAIGCTGGRHRSVYLAERLAAWLSERGRPVGLSHRDLDQSSAMVSIGAGGQADSPIKDIA
jgi:RNase adapter protein RapZ